VKTFISLVLLVVLGGCARERTYGQACALRLTVAADRSDSAKVLDITVRDAPCFYWIVRDRDVAQSQETSRNNWRVAALSATVTALIFWLIAFIRREGW
jgi:photosystem II stability/assembly factor-like uncharacterized protein